MKKKFLSILVAIAVTLSLSACQNGNTEQTAPLSDSATTVVEEAVEMKTIAPPEDGWTIEQLNDVMYLNGKPFKLPCTLEELGEEFTVDSNTILYKGNIVFGGNISDKGICNSFLFSVSQNKSMLPNDRLININGVTLETNLQDLFSKMGETELETKAGLTRITYNIKQLVLIFILDENMEIIHISLSWEE